MDTPPTLSPTKVQEIARLQRRRDALVPEMLEHLEYLIETRPEEAAVVERVFGGEGSQADKELFRIDFRFGFSSEFIAKARTGIQRYTFWGRCISDPERQLPGMLGMYGVDPHNKLNKMNVEELRALAWRCLSAHPGVHMTFNALSVRLFDLTADVTGDARFEDAVWSLLEDGCIAMSLEVPIYLLRTCDLGQLDAPAPVYQPRPVLGELTLF